MDRNQAVLPPLSGLKGQSMARTIYDVFHEGIDKTQHHLELVTEFRSQLQRLHDEGM